jgi:hypothetical protein
LILKCLEENSCKILYNGQMQYVPWEDLDLLKRYKNCTEFINEISRGFNHLKTDIKWDNNTK